MVHMDEAAVTHLVLCAIEDARLHVAFRPDSSSMFADPAAANRTVSRFLDNPRAELTLESGESVSALGLQRRYYAAVKAFIETHGDALASSLPATTIDTIMGEWSRVLTRWSVVHTMRSPTAWTVKEASVRRAQTPSPGRHLRPDGTA